MEMRKRAATIAACLMTLLTATAQQEVMKQINDIKAKATQENILTEQMMVGASDTTAFGLCRAGLLRQLSGGYTLDDIRQHVKTLVMNRGTRKLVFVYLDKDDLGAPNSGNKTQQKEPLRVQFNPEKNVTPPTTPKPPVTPTKPTTPTKPEIPTTTASPSSSPARSIAATDYASQPQPFFMLEVMSKRGAAQVERSLTLMKEQNMITDFGYLGKEKNVDDCFIILFKAQPPYAPIGVLSPLSGEKRYNFRTRQKENIEDHQGCGAFWLKTK